MAARTTLKKTNFGPVLRARAKMDRWEAARNKAMLTLGKLERTTTHRTRTEAQRKRHAQLLKRIETCRENYRKARDEYERVVRNSL